MKFVIILINRIRVLFSDRLFLAAMLVIPVLLSLITGYAQRKEKLGYIPFALVDEDRSDESELLIDLLDEKEGLKISVLDREEALERLADDHIEAMAVVEEGFSEAIREGELDNLITLVKSPSTVSSELLGEIIAMEVIRIYTGDFTYEWLKDSFRENGYDESSVKRKEVIQRYNDFWEPEPIMTISYEEVEALPQSDRTVTIPSFTAASLGLLVLFVMMGLLFGSGWLCEEKANGTLQRVMSVNGAELPLFIGNVTALFIMGLAQTVIFVGIQGILFKALLLTGALSWIVTGAYILCAASLSMLMASLFDTPNQLQAVAPVFALITGIMGGCLWNLVGVPKALQTMALMTPQGWALRAFTELYAAPSDLSFALPAILLLGGLSLIFLSISYHRLLKAGRM